MIAWGRAPQRWKRWQSASVALPQGKVKRDSRKTGLDVEFGVALAHVSCGWRGGPGAIFHSCNSAGSPNQCGYLEFSNEVVDVERYGKLACQCSINIRKKRKPRFRVSFCRPMEIKVDYDGVVVSCLVEFSTASNLPVPVASASDSVKSLREDIGHKSRL